MLQLVALIGKLEDKVGCCWWRVWALSDALAAIWCHCDGATEQGPVSLDADDAGPLNSLNNLHCCKVAKQLQILALDIFYCKVLSFRVTWYHCKVHVYLFWPLKHRLTLPGILHPVISKQPPTATAFKFDVVIYINATYILHLQIWAKPLCSLEQAIADTQAAIFCYMPYSLSLAGTGSSLLCYSLSYLFAVRMEL